MRSVHRSVLHTILIPKKIDAVTVRDRDTMEQVRIPIAELDAYFADRVYILTCVHEQVAKADCECPLYYDIAALRNGGQPFLRAVPIKKEICAIDAFKRVRL